MKQDIDSAFSPPAESLQEGREALAQLRAEIAGFFSEVRVSVITEGIPDTSQQVMRFDFNIAIPGRMRTKAMSALVSAKHSFDQSMFAAYQVLVGKKYKRYFPWVQSEDDLEARLIDWGIPAELHAAIRSVPPWESGIPPSGTDIRALASVANQKHTIGLQASPSPAQLQIRDLSFNGDCRNIAVGPGVRRSEPFFPGEILRWEGSGTVNLSLGDKVGFYIILDDPKVRIETEAVAGIGDFIAAAQSFHDEARRVCEDRSC